MRISELFREITEEFSKVVVGQEETLRLMLVAYLSRGHVLFEGVPGLGDKSCSRTHGEERGILGGPAASVA